MRDKISNNFNRNINKSFLIIIFANGGMIRWQKRKTKNVLNAAKAPAGAD